MRLLSVFLFSFFSLIVFYSCQKEVSNEIDDSSNPSGATGIMKAKINSAQWTADRLTGASRMLGLINITGVDNNKRYLTITLTDSGLHKYTLSEATVNVAALIDSTESNTIAYSTNQGTYPDEAGGEVNITSIDTAKKTLSGTFSFKVFRQMDGAQKTITEGSFTGLTYTTAMPPSASTDEFSVKIDGVSWTPHSVTGISSFGQIAINATSSTATKTVGLVFPSDIKPGTYTLDFLGSTYIGQYNPDTDPTHAKPSVSGTLTILEHNTITKRIRGNFAFRGEEMLNRANFAELTDGYFSVKYQR